MNKKYLLLTCAVCLLFISPALASAASFSISPASGTFNAGSDFSAKIMIDPAGAKINVAEAELKFDKEFISVTGISKTGSAFSLWATEPDFSNSQGVILFGGGSPSPISEKSTVITVKFKALKSGSANIAFSAGSILAADGKGTDVLSEKTGADFTIQEKAPLPPKEEPEEEPTLPPSPPVYGEKPEAPEITSSTHEKSNLWYSVNNVEFAWDVPYGATSARLLLSEEENAVPTLIKTPAINSRSLKDLDDGVWYFYVQLRNVSGWGEIGKKKIMIDTTPPLEFDITLSGEDTPKLFFETQDEPSGIDYYELTLGTDVFVVEPEEIIEGAYIIPPNEGGLKMVTVKAFDMAGNMTEAGKEFDVPFVAEPVIETKTTDEEEVIPPSPWTPERLLSFFFIFTTGVLTALIFVNRSSHRKEMYNILKEASEAREKSDKIFVAMREEIEEQINALDKKPQLTPEEREVLEKLREVLDISEELIAVEIEDVRKLAKK